MKTVFVAMMCLFLIFITSFAATSYTVTMEKMLNYNSWGAAWDTVVVIKNNIITLASVPKLGGRVMQYDLGPHPSLYINKAVINKTITDGNTMVGGFRQLASPQSDFNWPPAPTLDFGAYSSAVQSNSADSCVVYLESKVETSTDAKYATLKGLQFKRTLSMYQASSRVKVEMVMVNKSSATLNHGIWDITQTDCSNGGAADKQNIWVYFPLAAGSTLGGGKGYVQYMDQGKDTTQWFKNIVPGIMGVQYKGAVAKIGADCKAGWMCFVDRLDGYAYVKTFTYQAGKTYPDSGASVQVYTYQDNPVTEVEVLGPLTSLAPNDSVTLIENWYAARSKGPVYSVNSAGLVTRPIAVSQSGGAVAVQGCYGVFYTGKVQAVFTNAAGTQVAVADSYPVSPNDSFALHDTLPIAPNATKLLLSLYSTSGKLMGNLDSAAIAAVGVRGTRNSSSRGVGDRISIVRRGGVLVIRTPHINDGFMELTDIEGRLLRSFAAGKSAACELALPETCSGVLCVRVHHAQTVESYKVVVR